MSQSLPNETRINLAIQALQLKRFPSPWAAAKAYNVSKNTLQRRIDGTPPKSDATPPNEKLSEIEKEVLIHRIIDMDERGFSPKLNDVADIANVLISEDTRRGRDPVGKNWPNKFVHRTPSIRTRIIQPRCCP
jgi:hypothetical protein